MTKILDLENFRRSEAGLYIRGRRIVSRYPELDPYDEGLLELEIFLGPQKAFIWGLLNTLFVVNGEEHPIRRIKANYPAVVWAWYKDAEAFESSSAKKGESPLPGFTKIVG
jgi:hypothetical protein